MFLSDKGPSHTTWDIPRNSKMLTYKQSEKPIRPGVDNSSKTDYENQSLPFQSDQNYSRVLCHS